MSGDDLKRVRQTLCEIRDYCERIALHLHRINGKDGFLHDLMCQDACVMILGQIGEESKKIYEWLSVNSDYNWKDVIKFRDFIYHAYSQVNYNLVWSVLEKDLPKVMLETVTLIDTLTKTITQTENK